MHNKYVDTIYPISTIAHFGAYTVKLAPTGEDTKQAIVSQGANEATKKVSVSEPFFFT